MSFTLNGIYMLTGVNDRYSGNCIIRRYIVYALYSIICGIYHLWGICWTFSTYTLFNYKLA